jgi:very-short-patch-repair endonuclease
MLEIEIDGDSHRNKDVYDQERQAWLESQGVRFLRFDDALLRARPQDALRAIEGWIEKEESRG